MRELSQKAVRQFSRRHTIPDAVVILSAGIVEHKKANRASRWLPSTYEEDDLVPPKEGTHVLGALGGQPRAHAAIALWKKYNKPIVTTSRVLAKRAINKRFYGQKDWKILKDFLIAHGVPSSAIIPERWSTNTVEGLIQVIRMAQRHSWKNLVIITNDYHIPRTQLFYRYLGNKNEAMTQLKFLLALLSKSYRSLLHYHVHKTPSGPAIIFTNDSFFRAIAKLHVVFISAEKILSRKEPSFKKYFAQIKRSAVYKKRLANEGYLFSLLKKGTYGK